MGRAGQGAGKLLSWRRVGGGLKDLKGTEGTAGTELCRGKKGGWSIWRGLSNSGLIGSEPGYFKVHLSSDGAVPAADSEAEVAAIPGSRRRDGNPKNEIQRVATSKLMRQHDRAMLGPSSQADRLSPRRAGNCCLSVSLSVFPDFIVFCLIESHTHMHTEPQLVV